MLTETVLNNIAIGKSDNLVLRIVHICVPVDSCFDLENEISLHLWYTRQRTHWHDVSSSGGWDGWMRRRKARRGILYLWAIALSEIRLGRFDGSSTRCQTRLDLVAANRVAQKIGLSIVQFFPLGPFSYGHVSPHTYKRAPRLFISLLNSSVSNDI